MRARARASEIPQASLKKEQAVKTRRQLIEDTVSTLVARLMYYDRKEDEALPRGAIEAAVKAGEITRADIISKFGDELRKVLKD
jgi:hypothetical protein